MPATLADLIAAYRGTRQYRDLAREAGGSPSAPRWHDYATKNKTPEPDKVPAVAKALGVPVTEVWTAIGVTEGLDLTAAVPTSPLVAGLPPGHEKLTPAQVRLVVGIVSEFVNS